MSELTEYKEILENESRIYGVHIIRSDVNELGRSIHRMQEQLLAVRSDVKDIEEETSKIRLEVSTIKLVQEMNSEQIKELKADVAQVKFDVAGIKRVQEAHTEQIKRIHEDVRELKADVFGVKRDISDIKHVLDVHTKQIEELKGDVKELKHDMTEVKGDIKALSKGFETMQTRFGWGLVILGIIVTLVQFIK